MGIAFVVEGGEANVDVDPSSPTVEGIGRALELLDIGGSPDEWRARTSEGRILDNDKSLIEEGISKLARIYLSRGPSQDSPGIDKIREMVGLIYQQIASNLNVHTSTSGELSRGLRKKAALMRERMKAPVSLQNQKSLPLWKLSWKNHLFICEK